MLKYSMSIIDFVRNKYSDVYEKIKEFNEEEVLQLIEKEYKHILEDFYDYTKILTAEEKEKIISENKRLKDEQVTLRAQFSRIAKDFEDYVKQSEKNTENKILLAKQNATKKFAERIISILDILNLAKKSSQHDTNMLIGLQMLEKQFFDILAEFKITQKEFKIGDVFNEEFLEAMGKKTGGITNTLSEIISLPFIMKENILIKPGKVIIFE